MACLQLICPKVGDLVIWSKNVGVVDKCRGINVRVFFVRLTVRQQYGVGRDAMRMWVPRNSVEIIS